MRARFVILILIIAASATLTSAQSNNNDETFRYLIKQMADAQVAFDQSALNKIFTADYIEISPFGEVDPRAKVLGFYSPEAKAAMGDMKATIEPGKYSIRNYGQIRGRDRAAGFDYFKRRKTDAAPQPASYRRFSKVKERLEDRVGTIHGNSSAAAAQPETSIDACISPNICRQ